MAVFSTISPVKGIKVITHGHTSQNLQEFPPSSLVPRPAHLKPTLWSVISPCLSSSSLSALWSGG